MALEERLVTDRIEVLRDGTVQVREAIEVLRDGEVIATSYRRRVIDIEDDNPDVSWAGPDDASVVSAARSESRRQAAIQRKRQREGRVEEPPIVAPEPGLPGPGRK